jgi:riboflavin synthase
MFSGIIQSIGIVKDISKNEMGKNIIISSNLDTSKVKIGDSIAVSGCCLTVVSRNGKELGFYISSDTLKKTTLAMLSAGSHVNLESSLVVGDAIGGHLVSGHVDETGRVLEIETLGVDHRIKIEISNYGKNLLVQKGSISIDGVSLTVAYLMGNIATLNIIPHTFENTTMKFLNPKTNFLVNVEYEGIAKHVYKIVKGLVAR